MPTVPYLERQVQTRGVQPAQLNLPAGYGKIVPNTGMTNLISALDEQAKLQKKKADQVKLIENQRSLDQWEADNLFDPQKGALTTKGKNASGITQNYAQQYDQFVQSIYENITDEDQKVNFQKMAGDRLDTLKRTLSSHEMAQGDAYMKENAQASRDSSVNRAALYYNVPDIVQKAIKDAQTATAIQGVNDGESQAVIDVKKQEAESKVHMAVLSRMANTDPKMAVDYYKKNAAQFTGPDLVDAQRMMAPTERKYKASTVASSVLGAYTPKQTADQIIDYVMTDLEGGDKVITDNNGGTAKYGINSKGNGLTPEQVAAMDGPTARQLYKENYYDAIGADKMPADFRLVAFDAAVQHGVDDNTRKMIDDAGGDPRKLIEERRNYYIKLAQADPVKNGPQLEGWMNRLNKLSAQVDVMRGQEPPISDMNAAIDASTDDVAVAADAKELVKSHIVAIQADRKNSEDMASKQAYSYIKQGQPVPPTVEARMNPEEVIKMRTSNGTANMAVYQDVRQRILLGEPVELSQYQWQLGGRMDELVQLQQDPSKNLTGKTIDDVLRNATPIIIGKAKPEATDDFKKIDQFQRVATQQIEAMQKATGKPLGYQEQQQIVDRLLLEVNKSRKNWLDDTKRMYEVQPGEQITVDGIRSDGAYYVKGRRAAYSDVIDTLVGEAERRNLQPTPDILSGLLEELNVKGGPIAWKDEGK